MRKIKLLQLRQRWSLYLAVLDFDGERYYANPHAIVAGSLLTTARRTTLDEWYLRIGMQLPIDYVRKYLNHTYDVPFTKRTTGRDAIGYRSPNYSWLYVDRAYDPPDALWGRSEHYGPLVLEPDNPMAYAVATRDRDHEGGS